MALNNTASERQNIADEEFAKKISLESRVVTALNALFKIIGRDLETFFLATGLPLDASLYNDDVQGILSPHYRRTAAAFSGSITDFLEENMDNPDDRTAQLISEMATMDITGERTESSIIEELILAIAFGTQALIRQGVTSNTAFIGQTNQKEIDAAIGGAIASAAADPAPVTARQIAKDANDRFTVRAFGRSVTIAMTTTQDAAEGVKQLELQGFNNFMTPITNSVINAEKVWKTQGDSKVRLAHIDADEQKVDSGAPFVVQGELLMRPGDDSLGATAGNIINCRCSSVPFIE